MLMNESALRERCNKARYDILRRAKPKFWKSGKRKGQLRTPGITELPFTSGQLWNLAVAQVGEGCVKCPYCVAIGRPANIIDLANYVWDHRVPASRGGAHTLDNLFAVCADCNAIKSDLDYDFFIEFMAFLERAEARDRVIVQASMRSGISKRFSYRGKPKQVAEEVPPQTKLSLTEDF